MLPILIFYYALITSNQTSETIIKDYIASEATIMGVNPQMAIGIAEAESQFNNKASGDKNTSHGLFQIHLPAHKDITKEQAQDIIFSTTWSLQEMKKNGCKIWSTCKGVMKKINQGSS